MNLSELATMASYNIPVKMFIMNNTVLGMVRQWQKLFYENRFSDTDPHRVTDFVKVAEAFGVKGLRIHTNDDIDAVLAEALAYPGPCWWTAVFRRQQCTADDTAWRRTYGYYRAV